MLAYAFDKISFLRLPMIWKGQALPLAISIRTMRSLFGAWAALVLLSLLAATTPALARDFYLAPGGDDLRDGSSLENAVTTLARSLELALAEPVSEGETTRIVIAPGIYRDQSVELRADRLRNPLVITGLSQEPSEFPAFLGNGAPVWLEVSASSGQDTGLTIQNLRIVEYGTAITLNGNRDDPARFNSGTTITGNVFSRIGTLADGSASTAAVRMVNSRNNIVSGNYFLTIRSPDQCEALHALYLAHFSSGNRIENNSFDDFCGSAIKLRDRSNDNAIRANRFANGKKIPIIEEWFCDREKTSACTKPSGECPSTGNVAGDNRFVKISSSRRLVVRGGKKQRDWCDVSDFYNRRLVRRDTR